MFNMYDYVLQIIYSMTKYSFLMNKCVKYCNIIHVIYIHEYIKHNFIEVSICCPPREFVPVLQHMIFKLN